MVIYTENGTGSHKSIKTKIRIQNTPTTPNYISTFICSDKTYFPSNKICSKLHNLHKYIFQTSIYLWKPTGKEKNVKDNYVILLITFLTRSFTDQLICIYIHIYIYIYTCICICICTCICIYIYYFFLSIYLFPKQA